MAIQVFLKRISYPQPALGLTLDLQSRLRTLLSSNKGPLTDLHTALLLKGGRDGNCKCSFVICLQMRQSKKISMTKWSCQRMAGRTILKKPFRQQSISGMSNPMQSPWTSISNPPATHTHETAPKTRQSSPSIYLHGQINWVQSNTSHHLCT